MTSEALVTPEGLGWVIANVLILLTFVAMLQTKENLSGNNLHLSIISIIFYLCVYFIECCGFVST